MEKYDYSDAMYNDIADYVNNNDINLREYGDNIDSITEKLEEELWGEDTITGNGCFGYDNNFNCEIYLCHNLELLFEAIDEFNFDTDYHYLNKENLPRILDSLIRCYLLSGIIYKYVKDNWNDDEND